VRRCLSINWALAVSVIALSLFVVPSHAQIRGVYPLGMSATNSGVTPESGFTYVNQFLFYSRDQLKGPDGEVLATGQNSVMMDMNSLVWVSKDGIRKLGGALFSMSATIGGLADSYYQPFILGWRKTRADIRAVYGFLAPSGRFNVDASNNVGSGYWTHALSSGETFYLTANKATAISAFQMYEIHTTQQGTQIHPGQTLNLDYSLTHVLPLQNDLRVQLGVVGYEQWQTTDKTGPTITPAQATAHYRVNAIGFVANLLLPARKVNLGVKYFKEFSNRSTFQGYSLQISGAITF